jgi:hypothetical protein
MKSDFSTPEGIAIQTTDLTRWASVLTPEAFSRVFQEATRDNAKASSGHDICRGDGITHIVIKLSYQAL